MRILMLNNEFPPLGGGTGSINQALLQRFAGMPGLEIDLITSATGRHYEQGSFADGVRIFKVPVRNRNIHHSSNRELLQYAALSLPFALRLQHDRRYDFCFAWSAVPAGGVALALRGLAGLRYIVRVSGPDIPGFEMRYAGLYPFLSPAIRLIWHGAAAVVAKCRGEMEMIHAVDGRVPVSIVPNGVDITAFQPAGPIPDSGPLRLLCVARLIERKGQHHLIETVKRLTGRGIPVILELVGTGDALEANRELAERLGVGDRVHFVGYVPREEIAGYYSRAHVFVLPSYNEGMSVATLEALAAGLPVVVTRTGGTAELVEEGINGLTFAWADLDTLTSHLYTLATRRDLARQMSQAARRKARNFSWDFAVGRYLGIFEQLSRDLVPAV